MHAKYGLKVYVNCLFMASVQPMKVYVNCKLMMLSMTSLGQEAAMVSCTI